MKLQRFYVDWRYVAGIWQGYGEYMDDIWLIYGIFIVDI